MIRENGSLDEETSSHSSPELPVFGEGAEIWKKNLLSGFLVFLIALPLCLGIALASGFPPIAGVFTAVVGGLVSPWISNSELTIKGPAAGLIVIVLGAVTDFGGTGFGDGVWSSADQHAYQLTLGVGVAAALAQIAFGLFRGGILGEFFPLSAVHGLLAAIGVIIIAKQIPVALGVSASGSPLHLLAELPNEIRNANPEIALIGGLSLLILFGWPLIRHPWFKRVPAPLVVLIFMIPLGQVLGLDDGEPHRYEIFGHTYEVSSRHLVNVPQDIFSAVTLPDFSGVMTKTGLYWALLFALIGTLESLLSAKAVDLLDPWKRKTNLDRDNTAVGVGNFLVGFMGGLPMISEIVRSRVNIDSGARTRFSNLFHALFLLVFVVSVPAWISKIPLAALAAMLVFTGFRLAHPREFARAGRIGWDQFTVFTGTCVAVLLTDLLEGIAIGVCIELIVLVVGGAPLHSLFKQDLEEEKTEGKIVLSVKHAAVFSNWIGLHKRLHQSVSSPEVVVDLSRSKLVDHTVMEKLEAMKEDFEKRECRLVISGLDRHRPLSSHPLAARRAGEDR